MSNTYSESQVDVLPDGTVTRKKKRNFFIDNWFMITTIVGVVIGFGGGFAIQKVGINETGRTWINLPGTLYIRILQLTILPMIAANIINVMSTLNPKENGKVSVVSLAYILVANLVCSLIGVAYSYIIKPGVGGEKLCKAPVNQTGNQISYIFRDLLLNIFPDNIVRVTMFQASTNFSAPIYKNGEITYPSVTADGTNMIGVLFCSVVFGLATNSAKEKGKPFRDFFQSLGDVVMLLMQKFLLITPVGVLFMVMGSIVEVEDLSTTFIGIALFVALNFVGQLTHLIILMLSLVVWRKNPFNILKLSFQAWFIAFATTSGIVSLPKAFDACDTYGIPKQISRFVLPLAGTMKSDASGIFIAASCIFLAQRENVDLDAGKLVIIILLSFSYVSALPNIPSSSVVAVITILSTVGLNPKSTALLYSVEWINDRLRSGNVALSHLYCTAFTYHAVVKEFQEVDEIESVKIDSDREITYAKD